MIHINRFIALSCVATSFFVTSCVNEFQEGLTSENGEGYYITLTGGVNKDDAETRAHWDITDNDVTGQSLDFAWDESADEMKSFVLRNNAFVDFIDGQKYSATTVTPNLENDNLAQLNITTGLSQQYAADDVIWAVSPLKDATNYNISADNKVTFTLPDVYNQTVLNSTEHLKHYILMSGIGSVDAANTANIDFKVLPAIYRFEIVNNSQTQALTVNEVSISGPFCNKAVLSIEGNSVKPEYSVAEGGTYTIKVATPAEGLSVGAGATAYLYALVFPTKTSEVQSDITLSFKGKYGNTSVGYTKTKACRDVYKDSDLVSNIYYDMQVPVSESDTNVGDYSTMYLIDFEGNTTPENYVFGSHIPMEHPEPYKYNVIYYSKGNANIRFVTSKSNEVFFGMNTSGALSNMADELSPITIAEKGYYEISIDLLTMTYTIKSHTPTKEPYNNTFYLFGEYWYGSPCDKTGAFTATSPQLVADANNSYLLTVCFGTWTDDIWLNLGTKDYSVYWHYYNINDGTNNYGEQVFTSQGSGQWFKLPIKPGTGESIYYDLEFDTYLERGRMTVRPQEQVQ